MRNVNVIELTGGLGNQLYQYVYGMHLLRLTGRNFVCTFRNRGTSRELALPQLFKLRHEINSLSETRHLVNLQPYDMLLGELYYQIGYKFLKHKNYAVEGSRKEYFAQSNMFIKGYWQNMKYTPDFMDIVRSEMQFKEGWMRSYKKKYPDGGSGIIGVHVRRGDYVTNKKAKKVLGALPLDYYRKSIKHLNKLTGSKKLRFFTDDIPWVYNSLMPDFSDQYEMEIVDSSTAESDFFSLCHCEYKVISNSSFSWWAAQLSSYHEGLVCAPSNWFLNKTGLAGVHIPNDWQIIDIER